MKANDEFWNAIADKYAKQPVEDPAAFDAKIEATKALMTPRDIVLDIGCGTGSLALRLAPFAAEVYGLDLSKEMIRIAHEKSSASGVENVYFHVGPFDTGFDVFAPASLDGICAYSLLHLVEDRSAALAQIFGLLKPGAFFVSSTVCLGGSWLPYPAILKIMRWLGKAPLVKSFSPEALVAEMADAGFTDIQRPNVGAKSTIAFVVARRPAS